MRFFETIKILNSKEHEKREGNYISSASAEGPETSRENFGNEKVQQEEREVEKISVNLEMTKEEKSKKVTGKILRGKITSCLDHPRLIHWICLGFVGLATWCIIYSIAGSDFLPGSQFFSLIVLFALAYINGALFSLIKLPSLLGMLLMGLLLRNVGLVHLTGVYTEIAGILRKIALCIILIRGGLGLDPKSLKSLRHVILRLACIPGIVEGIITTIVTHFLLELPWLWGMLLGGILAAVSPAVVIPCLFSLQGRGYGTEKGIPTLVVAAASLDDILAITVFGVFLNVIYSADTSLIMQVVQGPLGILTGIIFGILWGFVAHFVPHPKDGHIVLLRVLMILGGGLMATVGSEAIRYQSAGPLGCITAAFVASLGWRKQGYNNDYNPVADVFRVIWLVLQPVLFGLIGSEVDISILKMSTVGNGLLALFCSLLGRIVVTVFVAFGAGFNLKEKIFVSLAWFPKATVQAALGPYALVVAKKNGSKEDIIYGDKILVLAVLAILITAPIGSILITILGPKLLSKGDLKPLSDRMQINEISLKSRGEEKNQI